jgi:hypothetical protein
MEAGQERTAEQRGDADQAGPSGHLRGPGQLVNTPPPKHKKEKGKGAWFLSHTQLRPSFPPNGPFNHTDDSLVKVERGVQGKTEKFTHIKFPATRLDDFHTGMAECSGVHTFPVDSSGVDRNFTRYECPRRGKAVESKTAPDCCHTGRGPARQRPVAIWGLPHTNCTASYSVHVADAWAIVRLPPGYAHNHATNTLPRFVSQQMRSNVETAWRRNGSNANATVVCEQLVESLVADAALAARRSPDDLKAHWNNSIRRLQAGEEVDKEDMPPRDYFLTPQYVHDTFALLEAQAAGCGGLEEREVVDFWVTANQEKVWHYVPGAADDESDVRLNVCSYRTLTESYRMQHSKGFSLGFFTTFGKEALIKHGNGKCIMMDATAGVL